MAKTQTKSRRLPRIILVGSLALNLLIIGLAAGVALNGGKSGGGQRFDLTVGPLTRAMDGEHRDAVSDALRDSGAFRPGDRTAMRSDMVTLLTTLRADSFDEAAFRAALMRQRARLQSGQDAVLDAVAAQIAEMTLEERNAFADRLQEQNRRGPPPRRQSN